MTEMFLTAREAELVDRSFQALLPISSLAAELFYARLFQIAPEVQPLFKSEMKSQGEKLMVTLGVVVAHLDKPDALLAEARDLAGRHVAYGVTPAHYAPVGAALIWTLEMGLGEGFDAETRAAWEKTYAVLSEAMVSSAYARAGAAAAAE